MRAIQKASGVINFLKFICPEHLEFLRYIRNTNSPAVLKIVCHEKFSWLSAKPVIHHFFHFVIICTSEKSQSLLQGSKQMKILFFSIIASLAV